MLPFAGAGDGRAMLDPRKRGSSSPFLNQWFNAAEPPGRWLLSQGRSAARAAVERHTYTSADGFQQETSQTSRRNDHGKSVQEGTHFLKHFIHGLRQSGHQPNGRAVTERFVRGLMPQGASAGDHQTPFKHFRPVHTDLY